MSQKLPKALRPFEDVLGPITVLDRDPICNEPVVFGFRITRFIEPVRFEQLQGASGSGGFIIKATGPQRWDIITGYLTTAEAIKKYGSITRLRRIGNGKFVSVTFGKKEFGFSQLDPSASGMDVPDRLIEYELSELERDAARENGMTDAEWGSFKSRVRNMRRRHVRELEEMKQKQQKELDNLRDAVLNKKGGVKK